MGGLEAGAGVCRATALLSVRPARAVVELGALGDVMHAVLNAAHHANRHGLSDDRIAVALPGLHIHRGRARPGQEVVLFGSEAALDRFLALEGVGTLRRRGMLAPLETLPVFHSPGETGTAFMRDRSVARQSPGARRRAAARTIRLGGLPRLPDEVQDPDRSILALHYGLAVVHMRTLEARVTGDPLLVNTYGFSSTQSPAALPISLALPLFDAA